VVRINGQKAIRHNDTCTLNNGNCPGEYVYVKDTSVSPPPDGFDQDNRSAWQKFKGQFMDKSETAKDAVGVWDKTKDVAGEVYNDPVGSAKAVGGYVVDKADATWEETKQVYKADGTAGVLGASVAVVGEAVSPSKKLKMAKEGAEAADKAGDALKATRALDNKKGSNPPHNSAKKEHFRNRKRKGWSSCYRE
jgi:hypothetical protein